MLAAGTKYVWVVRLVGPLRVEVHRPGKRKVVVAGDKELLASGVLTNPVPVRSLVEHFGDRVTALSRAEVGLRAVASALVRSLAGTGARP